MQFKKTFPFIEKSPDKYASVNIKRARITIMFDGEREDVTITRQGAYWLTEAGGEHILSITAREYLLKDMKEKWIEADNGVFYNTDYLRSFEIEEEDYYVEKKLVISDSFFLGSDK